MLKFCEQMQHLAQIFWFFEITEKRIALKCYQLGGNQLLNCTLELIFGYDLNIADDSKCIQNYCDFKHACFESINVTKIL